MNTLRNKVSLIGRLGAQPEVVKLETGATLVRFSLATNERYKSKEGEWKDNTQWHNITVWGKTAELASRLMKKGQEIAVEGRLVNSTFETKTGEKRYSTTVNLNDFLILSGSGDAKN
jgi:single-strand DNA-binding protein